MPSSVIKTWAIYLFACCFVLRCATDPGTSTPTTGGAVTYFTYDNGDLGVIVNVERPSITAGVVLFDINSESGLRAEATQFEPAVSVVWPDSLTFGLPDCEAAPTLVSTEVFPTSKIFHYTYPDSCASSTEGTVTSQGTLVINKTGYPSRTINGSGGSGGTVAEEYHTAFLTSSTWQGNQITLVSGGDSKCATAAATGSKTSSLSGTWRAIISSSTSNAKTRITFTSGAALKNTNGETVVSAASNLWSGGSLSATIGFDANGAAVSTAVTKVWTGTTATGTSTTNCTDWGADMFAFGYAGTFTSTSTTWIYDALTSCAPSGHLYCVNSNN